MRPAVATGDAPISFPWRFNGTNLSGATASDYNFTAWFTNEGDYREVISNPGGAVTSSVATLTVILPDPASLDGASKTLGGPFQMTLSGTTNGLYEIQSNTNLNNTNAWMPVVSTTNAGGQNLFSDFSASNAPQKFYRAIAR